MITLTLDELKALVERISNQSQYHNMKPYANVSIHKYPNGREYLELEQPCAYPECNGTCYTFEGNDKL